jgi:hypothetical protein
MTTKVVKLGKELQQASSALIAALGEALGSLVGRPVVVRASEPELTDHTVLPIDSARPAIAARGALDNAFAGKSLLVLFDLADAVTMAGLLMMKPDAAIAERRAASTLQDDDAQAFGELGNTLFATLAGVLRERIGGVEVRHQDHALVAAGSDRSALLGAEPLLAFGFTLKVDDHPESKGVLLVDAATATTWNKSPLDAGNDAAGTQRLDDDGIDSVPAAPIRGSLAA